jgi:hypothetical protein
MSADDSNTEDLIVRALTGQDHAAKAAIERAAQDDPELQKFYSELSTVVQKMTECRDWRAEPPTPTARERVRQAVLARLQMAPPRFKAVILDVEVARQKVTQRMRIGLVCVTVLGACVAGAIVFASGGKPNRLQLSGQPAFEASDGKDQPEAWASFAGELIGVGLTALKQDAPVNTLYLKRGFPIDQALAYQVDLDVPDFEDTASSVTLFLADAMNLSPPAFTPEGRPERSISLVLNADSLVLYDASQAFLGSRPLGKAQGFYTLRIEYLGAHLRVLVKGEVFYDGPLNQVLRGPLHIGLRTSGSRKAGLRFNAVRIER